MVSFEERKKRGLESLKRAEENAKKNGTVYQRESLDIASPYERYKAATQKQDDRRQESVGGHANPTFTSPLEMNVVIPRTPISKRKQATTALPTFNSVAERNAYRDRLNTEAAGYEQEVNKYLAGWRANSVVTDPVLADTNKKLSDARKQLEQIRKLEQAETYGQEYLDGQYDDNFLGQTKANYAVGRMSQDSSAAWNAYLNNPTEANRKYAESIDAALAKFREANAETLADDAALPWLSQSFAQYVPQLMDQTKAGAAGALGGAVAGGTVIPGIGALGGARAGYMAGVGMQSYDLMRGSAFKSLIDAGFDEETAMLAASDEGLISAMIEMADAGVDIMTLGGLSALKSGISGMFKTTAGKNAYRKALETLGKYGINVGSEGLEEGLQEVVSLGNAKRLANGDTSIKGLFESSFDVAGEAFRGEDPEARASILDAAKEGAKISAVMAGADAVVSRTGEAYRKYLDAKHSKAEDDVPDKNIGNTQKPAEAPQSGDIAGATNTPTEAQTPLIEAQAKQAMDRDSYLEKYYHENGANILRAEAEKRGSLQDAEDILRPFYTAGVMGMRFDEVEQTAMTVHADPVVAMNMYQAGVNDRAADMTARLQGQTKLSRQTPGVLLKTEAVTEKQKALANLVAKLGKVEVEIVDTLPSRANGEYKDGRIYVALDAESFSGALFHETVHYIAQANAKGYDRMAQTVMRMAAEVKGMSVDAYVRAYEGKRKGEFGDMYESMIESGQYDAIALREELVADAFQMLVADEARCRSLIAELKQSDPTILEQIKEFLQRMLETLEGLVKDGRFHSFAEDINKDIENTKKLQKIFAEELRVAGENMGTETKVQNEDILESVGVQIDTETESAAPKMSLRTWKESDYVTERNKAAKEMAEKLGITQKKAKAYIDAVNGVAKMIADNPNILDYESNEFASAFVSNSEYGGSIDFSTICKKRRWMTGTLSAIQRALPHTALTAEEVLDIRNRMKEKGYEVSCGLCYVEGSRTKMGEFTSKFIELYKRDNPPYVPTMAEMNTPEGLAKMMKEHPEVYDAYEYFYNHYGKLRPDDKALFASQQKPKLYQLATEYKGEVLEKFKDDEGVELKNKNGGLRLQSFSDFEVIHLIDAMQVITDMARVGLAGQAYTKVPDFAWALGDTGLKINLSLIAKGVDENGNIVLDEVEGMSKKDAETLRNRYSDNVGTIIVVFNDEQLYAAMKDDFIDFIIPFHRSQWKKAQYPAMGLPAKVKDYTYQQNEKLIKKTYHEWRGKMVLDKPTNYMPNEYWDFTKSGKENAENYLQMCAENNKRPKFYKLLKNNGDGSYSLQDDGSTDGYWKLLIDFKMYNNEGKGVPQKAVVPEFNMDEAFRMLGEYGGDHAQFPVAQDVVDEFVAEKQGAKFSVREEYYDDYEGETFETKAEAELNDIIREFGGIAEGSVPHQGDVERISREFLHKIKSKYPMEEFTKKFGDILGHVMRAGNSRDMDTAIRALTILSKEAMGQSEKLNTKERDKYRDVVTLLRETPLEITPAMKEELKDYGGFVNFRNRYFNRMKLNNSGEDVEGIYNEIVEKHPDLIASVELQEGEELSKVDMLVALAEIVDNTRPYLENPYEMDMDTFAKDAAYELIDKVNEVGTQTGKMLELHKEYKEKMSEMRKQLKTDRREQALNRRRSANRRAIERDVIALRKWISKPTNQKHIPERFRQNLAAILVKIVGSSKEMKLSAADLTRFGAEYARLNPEYSGNDKGSIHLQDYDAEIELMISKLKKAAERSGGTLKLSDMNREQMEWLRKTIKGLRKALENANELVSAESDRKASEEAEAFIEMADTMRKAPRGKVLRRLLDMFSLSMLTPEMFMKGLGDRMYNILWKGYSKGHAKKATMTQQAMDFMNDLIKPSEVSGWQKAALKEVTLTRTGENGETISHTLYMSIPQIMYLHCAVKRNQAKKHLFGDDKTAGSGMKIEPEEKIRLRGRKTAKKALEQTEVLKLTEDEVREVTALLTDRQKEVADKMQKFLTEVVSEWGNETSMLMYGYRKFTESNYIPIIVDSEYTNKMYGKENPDAKTLQNMGAAKEVSEWAGQPIVITDIFSLFNRHVDQMSSYNAFVPILSDTNKFMNYMKMPKNQNDLVTKEEADAIRATMTEEEIQAWEDIRKANEEDNEMPAVEEKEKTGPVAFVNKTELKSVKNAMSHILGPKAEAYMHKLMVDINGAAKKDDVGVVPQMALRNMKIASVGANLRVIVQQPMSMFRAMAEMNPADVLFAPFALPKDWEKMRKYAPITLWKDWGGAEMDTGRTLEEMIAGQSLFNKITGLSMAPAGALDKLTWGRLWKGCEMEVKRKHPDWVGERLNEAVGERFTQVIDRTQVVDSVLHRSENMRSKSFFVKMTTSFMSEPIKGYNLVYDAVRGVYRNPKDKEAHKRLTRVLFTHFINAVMVSLAAGLVDAMRDGEDDDDEFWDTWLAASVGDYSKAVTLKDKAAAFWASNLNDNLNPMNMLPYVKDVYSVIQGYDVVRTDFSWATDIVRWVQKTKKMNEGGSEYSVKGYILYTAAQFSKVTGLPAKSLERDLYGLADTLIQHTFDDAEGRYSLRTFKYAPGKEDNAAMYAEMIVMARFNGDTVLANRIKGDMLNGGMDEEKLDTKLENAYSKKVEIAYIEDDTTKLAEIRNQIQKDGYKEKVYNQGIRDGAKELFEAALAVKDEDEARRLIKVVEEHNGSTDSMMEDFNDTFNN